MSRPTTQTRADVAICLAVMMVAATPAETEKRNGTGKMASGDAKYCTVLGV